MSYVDPMNQGAVLQRLVRVQTALGLLTSRPGIFAARCSPGATNINIAAPSATMDGSTAVSGDAVLLWFQTDGTQNGVWVFNGAGVPLTRHPDFAVAGSIKTGQMFYVKSGSAWGQNYFYVNTTTTNIIPGTTSLGFNFIGKSDADRNRANHTGSPTAAVSNGGFKMTNMADGTVATDSATFGQLPKLQVDTTITAVSATAWTKPTNAKRVVIEVHGAGGPGGSGRKGALATSRLGGSGGGRGGYSRQEFQAAALPSTLYLWNAASGAVGASVTAADTNGNSGTVAPNGTFVSTSSSATLATARAAAIVYADPGLPGAGGTAANTVGGVGGPGSESIGGNGGDSNTTSGGQDGFLGGGGGGGSATAANLYYKSGGSHQAAASGIYGATNPGTPVSTEGVSGSPASTVSVAQYGPVRGIGGAGGTASSTTNGGNGSAGVFGGGGGGGAAAVNAVGNSGAGGLGGTGYIVITTYF